MEKTFFRPSPDATGARRLVQARHRHQGEGKRDPHHRAEETQVSQTNQTHHSSTRLTFALIIFTSTYQS